MLYHTAKIAIVSKILEGGLLALLRVPNAGMKLYIVSHSFERSVRKDDACKQCIGRSVNVVCGRINQRW